MKKFQVTDPQGKNWKYVDYERDTYGMTAIFESDDEFNYVYVPFIDQEGETISGWEYPDHEPYSIQPGETGFDYNVAVTEALEEAKLILSEGRVEHAA
ncbi:trafficking protein particle complex II-specific subunit 120 [Parapedobacter lycopersici]|uniref:trafficking protein particle complex II-specific subunit 120 n=1 Tax=Parapedobacter lycopersici TaxID=1864939 RepID=UPI00214D4F7C|nr:trafficking protein particle complex II-specific subunit 120 [Parapedobacter lycopersici]